MEWETKFRGLSPRNRERFLRRLRWLAIRDLFPYSGVGLAAIRLGLMHTALIFLWLPHYPKMGYSPALALVLYFAGAFCGAIMLYSGYVVVRRRYGFNR